MWAQTDCKLTCCARRPSRSDISGSELISPLLPAALVNLWLARVQQRQQARIVGVVSIVDQRINQIRRGHRCAVRKCRRVPDVNRNCVGAVLHGPSVEHEIHPRNRGVPQRKVSRGAGAETIQIESRVRLVVRTIVENDHKAAQRSIACSAIVRSRRTHL